MSKKIYRSKILDEFIHYRINYNRWNNSYQANLIAFNNYCNKFFSNEPDITQDMLNKWYENRPSESLSSTRSRIQVITALIHYIQKRYDSSLYVPELPAKSKNQYIPHSFSNEELAAFFEECDRQVLSSAPGEVAFKALTISVMFRTLYSTGMRTTEVRLLKPENINFDEGIISIQSTKGNRRHFVALDFELNTLLINYNTIAESMYPTRSYFFYNKYDKEPFSAQDLRYHFNKIWNKVNNTHAVPYDFRHNYAVQNINRWIATGIEFHDKFLYLSKSMGHSSLESTKYYYHLVPLFANIMYSCDNTAFDSIIPEVMNYEEE